VFDMNKNLRRFSIIIFLLLSLSFIGVFAEPTYQYNKILLTPYYRDSMSSGQNYTYTLKINPPDNYNKTVSALLSWYVWMTPTVTYTVTVNGKYCNNPTYLIHTTYAGSGQAFLSFDCSNIIKDVGTYTITLSGTKNSGSSYAWLDFVYMNNPLYCGNVTGGNIDVVGEVKNPVSSFERVKSIGGTEYSINETSRIVLQILNSTGYPLNNENCFTTVRDSNDELQVDNQSLTYISGSNGLYFYQFNLSLPIGVYSVDSYCNFDGTTIYSADTFHVGEWTQDIKNLTTSQTFVGYVGGTEYFLNDTIELVVQYLENWGTKPVSGKYCRATIYNANGNSVLYRQNLTYISGSNGIYQYAWMNPNLPIGVYSVDVECCKKSNYDSSLHHGASSFHINSGNISYVQDVGNVSSLSGYELKYAGGTEYLSGTEGQVAYQFLRTIAGNPSPINDGTCNISIWYPNNTFFMQNQSLNYLTQSDGVYFRNFTVPTTNGVYKTNAICKKGGIFTYEASTFHVENSLFNNQQTIYSFLQTMNTTIVSNQQYIISLVQNVSTQITNSWNEFWGSVSARITS